MSRLLPLLVVLAFAACSQSPETEPSATQSAESAPAASEEAATDVKPVPETLPEVLARVNGEDVTRKEFEDYVQNMEGRAGGPVPPDQRDRVYRGVLDRIVGYKLLVQEADAQKVLVADADVEARLGEVKKQFPSEALFMQTLIERKMTLDELKADARKDIAIAKLIEAAVAPKVAVQAGDAENFYTQNPDQFQQEERVRASHILIAVPQDADPGAKAKAKARAEQVMKDATSGKDFTALARQHSEDSSAANGGDLGFFERGRMVGPFNDAAFSLKPGTISGLVETEFGYHIIKVAEKQPARTVPLEEVRPQVERYLEERNREAETEAFVKGLRAKAKVEILI